MKKNRTDIANICSLLEKKFQNEERRKKYALVKEVLVLLGKGALLTSLILVPGMGRVVRRSMYSKKADDYDQAWKRYNESYLRQTIQRLKKQKLVDIVEDGRTSTIQITEKGIRRVLKYAFDELELDQSKPWDRKWRIVIYDIPVKHRSVQNELRFLLKRLKFFPLQKSVYLTPHPCEEEVEFIRTYIGLEKNITLLTVGNLEHGDAYLEYFGI